MSDRSKNKNARDLTDAFFVDVLMGVVPVKNPEFQVALEKRIDALLAAELAERETAFGIDRPRHRYP